MSLGSADGVVPVNQRQVGVVQPLPLRIVRAGTSPVRQGEVTESAWIVETGLLRMWAIDDGGRELVLDLLGPGDLVGDGDGAVSAWTVTSLGPGRLRPTGSGELAEARAARRERITALACQLAWLEVRDRIEVRLTELASRIGRPVSGGIAPSEDDPGRRRLARRDHARVSQPCSARAGRVRPALGRAARPLRRPSEAARRARMTYAGVGSASAQVCARPRPCFVTRCSPRSFRRWAVTDRAASGRTPGGRIPVDRLDQLVHREGAGPQGVHNLAFTIEPMRPVLPELGGSIRHHRPMPGEDRARVQLQHPLERREIGHEVAVGRIDEARPAAEHGVTGDERPLRRDGEGHVVGAVARRVHGDDVGIARHEPLAIGEGLGTIQSPGVDRRA